MENEKQVPVIGKDGVLRIEFAPPSNDTPATNDKVKAARTARVKAGRKS